MYKVSWRNILFITTCRDEIFHYTTMYVCGCVCTAFVYVRGCAHIKAKTSTGEPQQENYSPKETVGQNQTCCHFLVAK